MKKLLSTMVMTAGAACAVGATGTLASFGASAQAAAPPGATGLCNDGTFTTVTDRNNACTGHGGVKTWFASSAPPGATPTGADAPGPGGPPPAASGPASGVEIEHRPIVRKP